MGRRLCIGHGMHRLVSWAVPARRSVDSCNDKLLQMHIHRMINRVRPQSLASLAWYDDVIEVHRFPHKYQKLNVYSNQKLICQELLISIHLLHTSVRPRPDDLCPPRPVGV